MDELMALIARMVHHYREGGAGYTWLDAAIDVVGEHGYTILSDNRDADGSAAILINDETLESTRQMIERLRHIGADTETVTGCGLAELDEEAGVLREALSDLLIELLVEADLVQPLVASQASRTITDGDGKQPPWPKGWGGLAFDFSS